MLIKSEPTTLLQIFCEIMFDSKVISKNVIGPDNNFHVDLQASMAKGADCEMLIVLSLKSGDMIDLNLTLLLLIIMQT